jgi:hypothetical protein
VLTAPIFLTGCEDNDITVITPSFFKVSSKKNRKNFQFTDQDSSSSSPANKKFLANVAPDRLSAQSIITPPY